MNEQMIEKYKIALSVDKTNLIVYGKVGDTDKEYIKGHKDELVDILVRKEQQEEQERNERRKRIEAIEGLVLLQTAITDWNTYNNAMSRYIERDCTGKAPEKPKETVEELARKYPRAAAYVKADRWSYSSHYYKALCGKRAKEAILNGDSHEEVISDMKSAWSKYIEENTD